MSGRLLWFAAIPATAILLRLAIPPGRFGILGLVAFVPLLLLARQKSQAAALAAGFLSGLCFHLLSLPWVFYVMTVYGGLGKVSGLLVMLLLHLYLSLYFGLFCLLVARLSRWSSAGALLLSPLLWMGLEWVRGWAVTGFPWIPLGMTAWKNLPLLQQAEWGGYLIVSGLVMAANAGIVLALVPGRRRRGAVMLGLVAAAMLVGAIRLRSVRSSLAADGAPLTVGVVQANVPLNGRWKPETRRLIEMTHDSLSREVVRDGAKLVIWSESSIPIPGGYLDNRGYQARLADFVGRLGVPVIFGGTTYQGDAARNSAMLLDAKGKLAGRYDKQHLVPFGEYVPLKRFLFFAGKLVDEVGDFEPGPGPRLLDAAHAKIGVPICYELVFPEICRNFAKAGADLIVTITNDAWFGTGGAASQHFAEGVFRAVETRRFVVRCANSGISGVIAPTGEVLHQTPLFRKEAFVSQVKLVTGITPFVRTGDLLGPACGLLLLLALVWPWVQSRHPVPRQS